ncbi:unnamed protein product [Ectocarpus sp. CCAP 1310/34]|nr:unnamed protein product [Ectocarpus sp. CCAP 1310/34]
MELLIHSFGLELQFFSGEISQI